MPANPLPPSSLPASGKPCQGATKTGGPCPWKAEGLSSYCLLHDPLRAEERAQKLRERGKNGKQKQVTQRRQAARDVSLATTAKIRELLEEAASLVRESGADATVKAHALARLCSVAHDTLRTSDLERQVEELRQQVEQIGALQ